MVGVDHEPHVRPRATDRRDALERPVGAEFDLEQAVSDRRSGVRRHVLRLRIKADRVDGLEAFWLDAGQRPDALAAALRLEIPQREVEDVARPAGRQQPLEFVPIDALLDACRDRLDRGTHLGHVVAEIEHTETLAAADDAILCQLDHHRIEAQPFATGDAKGPCGRPALDVQGDLHSGNSCRSRATIEAVPSRIGSTHGKPVSAA